MNGGGVEAGDLAEATADVDATAGVGEERGDVGDVQGSVGGSEAAVGQEQGQSSP